MADDAFAEITPTPHTADTAPWSSPPGLNVEHLDNNPPSAGGPGYGGIPQGLNGSFSEHADAPPDSVPAAMAPAAQMLCADMTVQAFPAKDID